MHSEMVEYARRPLTIEDFHRMAEAGIFDPDERLELIDGELVVPPHMDPRHAGAIERLYRLLIARVGARASVRCQVPLPMLPRSEPSPDFTIVPFDPRAYVDRHPGPDEVYWLIEVGDATRTFDRTRKLPIYARHGVREVWLLDLVDRRLRVSREPTELGYAQMTVLGPGAKIAPEHFPDVWFSVDELL